jgi:hypothetical protein
VLLLLLLLLQLILLLLLAAQVKLSDSKHSIALLLIAAIAWTPVTQCNSSDLHSVVLCYTQYQAERKNSVVFSIVSHSD